MKRIGFDPNSGTLVVMGGEVYPPCALSAVADGAGMIRIVSASGRVEVYEHWTRIGPLDYPDGFVFPDEDGALAYLAVAFGTRAGAALPPDLRAAADLGGHRVVRVLADGRLALASCAEPAHAGFVLGLTRAAAAAGSLAAVVVQGLLDEPSFAFAPGPVYLGRDGALSQAPPTAGFVQRVALALAPTRLLVALDEPYLLA